MQARTGGFWQQPHCYSQEDTNPAHQSALQLLQREVEQESAIQQP